MPYCEHCDHCRADELDGASLRKRRQALRLGLREFSGILRISPSYLSDIERGNRRATIAGKGGDILIVLTRLEYDAERVC